VLPSLSSSRSSNGRRRKKLGDGNRKKKGGRLHSFKVATMRQTGKKGRNKKEGEKKRLLSSSLGKV